MFAKKSLMFIMGSALLGRVPNFLRSFGFSVVVVVLTVEYLLVDYLLSDWIA